jgi:hypothetical protein
MAAEQLTPIFERLVAAGIQILPATDLPRFFVFERGGMIALVERVGEGFGAMGSAGILTAQGMAVLMWRDGRPVWLARGFEQTATEEEVALLRRFSEDLEHALSAGSSS